VSAKRLCLFKSSRRQEYTRENLRILSGVPGDIVDVGYMARWVDRDVMAEAPRVGDRAVVVLADPPYETSTPIRTVEIASVESDETALLLRLRLGPRVATDSARWAHVVGSGGHPKAGSFVSRLQVDGCFEEATDRQTEQQLWLRQVEAISTGEGYRRVAFLGVESVVAADGVRLEPPYLLRVGQGYTVTIRSHNPHLGRGVLRSLRLLPRPDATRVALAMDAMSIPAEGSFGFHLEPLADGATSLEFNVARGSEFWFAFQLSWDTTLTAGPPDDLGLMPDTSAARVVVGEEARPGPRVTHDRDAAAEELLRGYRLVGDRTDVPDDVRLGLLDHMLAALPRSTRLQEQRGIALARSGQLEDAVEVLEQIPPSSLAGDARTTLVEAWFRLGRLPTRLDDITIAEFSRPGHVERLREASASLTSGDQVRVALYLADGVLTDHHASDWIGELLRRTGLARADVLSLFETWQYIDSMAAARSFEALAGKGAIDLADPRVASLALDLGLAGGTPALRRSAIQALQVHYQIGGPIDKLVELLGTVMARLPEDERVTNADPIVRAILGASADVPQLEPAMEVASHLIDLYCRRGELDRAVELADASAASVTRVAPETRARFELAQAELEALIDRSPVLREYREARRASVDAGIRAALGGKRVLVAGGLEPEWWGKAKQDLGLSGDSQWLETSKRKSPKPAAVKKLVQGAALIAVETDNIGHSFSQALVDAADSLGVQRVYVSSRGRAAFVADVGGVVDGLSIPDSDSVDG
jgi:hypothetical protein